MEPSEGVGDGVRVGVGVGVSVGVELGVSGGVAVGPPGVAVGVGVDRVAPGIKRSQAQPYSGLLPFKASALLTNISNTPFDTVTTPNTCSVNWPIVPVFMS